MKLHLKPLNDEIRLMYENDALEVSNMNRATRGDAGLDLYCPGDMIIQPGQTVKIDFKIQQVSQDNYLKTYKLKSPLITNETVLNSKIELEGNNENLDFSLYTEVYEDLSKETSDRYEFIFPSYSLTKYIENSLDGELSFTSNANSKLYDTNIYTKTMVNNLNL